MAWRALNVPNTHMKILIFYSKITIKWMSSKMACTSPFLLALPWMATPPARLWIGVLPGHSSGRDWVGILPCPHVGWTGLQFLLKREAVTCSRQNCTKTMIKTPQSVANAKLFGVTCNDLSIIIACFSAVLLTKMSSDYGVNLCYNDSVAKFVVAILKLWRLDSLI